MAQFEVGTQVGYRCLLLLHPRLLLLRGSFLEFARDSFHVSLPHLLFFFHSGIGSHQFDKFYQLSKSEQFGEFNLSDAIITIISGAANADVLNVPKDPNASASVTDADYSNSLSSYVHFPIPTQSLISTKAKQFLSVRSFVII